MIAKARWTTTSASSTSASTASRSSTSPRLYSVFSQPCPARSKGRRAMPITRSTSGIRSSEEMKALPISPVGPVTATVSMRRFWRNARAGDGKLWPLQSGAHVDDLEQTLQAAKISCVQGAEREVVCQRSRRDRQRGDRNLRRQQISVDCVDPNDD